MHRRAHRRETSVTRQIRVLRLVRLALELHRLALSHDIMARLLEIRSTLADRLRTSGGELRVGIFAAQAHADDADGKRREVREGLDRAPWIRDLIPFDAQTLAVLNQAEAQTARSLQRAPDIAEDERRRPPQLHQKTQVIARPGAIAALVRRPGWDRVVARSMEVQAAQSADFAQQLGYVTPDVDSLATRATDALLGNWEADIPEAERNKAHFFSHVRNMCIHIFSIIQSPAFSIR